MTKNILTKEWLDKKNISYTISAGGKINVGGSLDLQGTQIAALPDNLTVGGSLYLQGTQIAAPRKLKRPDSDFSVKMKMSIEVKFNLRGRSIADGVFAKILSTKGPVRRVMVVGKKDASYLVGDGNGNFAHGETLAKAHEDLIFKAVAKFDGELPKKATGKEWVVIYRAVTGACAAGCRGFVEGKAIDLDASFTAEEISKMVAGQFGADKFAEKLK